MSKQITQEYLRSVVSYDPESGIFRRTRCRRTDWIGKEAGYLIKGYRQVSIDNRRHAAHKLAWLYMYNEWPEFLDHINGDRDDNRICNLRVATKTQNLRNTCKKKTNTSGYKGVSHRRNKWRAYITVDWKTKHLGVFNTPEEAHAAYCVAAHKYHGEFARVA